MKRLICILAICGIVAMSSMVAAQQVEIEGKKYTFMDIVYENILDSTVVSFPRIMNPFDRKIVKIYVAPEANRDARFNDTVWWVPSLQMRVSTPNRLGRFYILETMLILETVLVAPQKTEWGTVRFDLHKTHYGKRSSNILYHIFDTFVDAVEQRHAKPSAFPLCIELTGELYLSRIIQKNNVKDLGKASVNFILDPQDAVVAECPK